MNIKDITIFWVFVLILILTFNGLWILNKINNDEEVNRIEYGNITYIGERCKVAVLNKACMNKKKLCEFLNDKEIFSFDSVDSLVGYNKLIIIYKDNEVRSEKKKK